MYKILNRTNTQLILPYCFNHCFVDWGDALRSRIVKSNPKLSHSIQFIKLETTLMSFFSGKRILIIVLKTSAISRSSRMAPASSTPWLTTIYGFAPQTTAFSHPKCRVPPCHRRHRRRATRPPPRRRRRRATAGLSPPPCLATAGLPGHHRAAVAASVAASGRPRAATLAAAALRPCHRHVIAAKMPCQHRTTRPPPRRRRRRRRLGGTLW